MSDYTVITGDNNDKCPQLAQDETGHSRNKIIEKAPWWLISFGLHILLILISIFIIAILPTVVTTGEITLRQSKNSQFDLKSSLTDLNSTSPSQSDQDREIKDTKEITNNENKLDFDHKAKSDREPLSFVPKNPGIKNIVSPTGGKNLPLGPLAQRFSKDGKKDDPTTRPVVDSALDWLARHQNSDGSWSITECTANCGKFGKKGNCKPEEGDSEYDIGATGLALLAFMGEGYMPGGNAVTNKNGINYDEVVKKGLLFLKKNRDASGRIGNESDHMMYNHVIAALALTEGYLLRRIELFRNAAQKGVDFVIKAQNVEKVADGETGETRLGWTYISRGERNDSSITGWCSMLLKSAEYAQLSFPKSAYEGIRRWYDNVTDDDTGIVGYDKKWRSSQAYGAVLRGSNGEILNGKDRFDIQPALTAIAIMSKLFINKGNKDDKTDRDVKKIITEHLPECDKENRKVDFYYWYNASYALFQYYPTTGSEWKRWNNALKEALIGSKKQNSVQDECKVGSWEPIDRWSCKGGRVSITALGALILQVYYRYAQLKERW